MQAGLEWIIACEGDQFLSSMASLKEFLSVLSSSKAEFGSRDVISGVPLGGSLIGSGDVAILGWLGG